MQTNANYVSPQNAAVPQNHASDYSLDRTGVYYEYDLCVFDLIRYPEHSSWEGGTVTPWVMGPSEGGD